jgi:DNA helicase MCM9
LTASSYKEDKETHVEAGALVLANHGICCIDEFNLLSTRNRGALHDAMEHQKFSFMQGMLLSYSYEFIEIIFFQTFSKFKG